MIVEQKIFWLMKDGSICHLEGRTRSRPRAWKLKKESIWNYNINKAPKTNLESINYSKPITLEQNLEKYHNANQELCSLYKNVLNKGLDLGILPKERKLFYYQLRQMQLINQTTKNIKRLDVVITKQKKKLVFDTLRNQYSKNK